MGYYYLLYKYITSLIVIIFKYKIIILKYNFIYVLEVFLYKSIKLHKVIYSKANNFMCLLSYSKKKD